MSNNIKELKRQAMKNVANIIFSYALANPGIYQKSGMERIVFCERVVKLGLKNPWFLRVYETQLELILTYFDTYDKEEKENCLAAIRLYGSYLNLENLYI